MHKVLVKPLGGLSLPRKSVVRLTDHQNLTIDVTMDFKGRFMEFRKYYNFDSLFSKLSEALYTKK